MLKEFLSNVMHFYLNFELDIICFFASKGFWPFYPAMLQYQVNEMGKKLLSLSDERIRQFCCGKINFQETCVKPGELKFFKLVSIGAFFWNGFLFLALNIGKKLHVSNQISFVRRNYVLQLKISLIYKKSKKKFRKMIYIWFYKI